MITYTRQVTDTSFIWVQKEHGAKKLLYIGAMFLVLTIILMYALLQRYVSALFVYLPFTALVVLALLDAGDLMFYQCIASISGKKISKSGNWWTGNLKYEIEK